MHLKSQIMMIIQSLNRTWGRSTHNEEIFDAEADIEEIVPPLKKKKQTGKHDEHLKELPVGG